MTRGHRPLLYHEVFRLWQDIFEGKLLPLKKGYIGVVNRSQAEIDGNRDIKEALKKEDDFFRHHKAYK